MTSSNNYSNSPFLKNVPNIDEYDIQTYQFVDDYRALRPLSEYSEDLDDPFDGPSAEEKVALIEVLRCRLAAAFIEKGWEGDGEIKVVFIPPFLCDTGETSCIAVFHVKQDNDGISFFAFPRGVKLRLAPDLGKVG